jgi:hypothetical protein
MTEPEAKVAKKKLVDRVAKGEIETMRGLHVYPCCTPAGP